MRIVILAAILLLISGIARAAGPAATESTPQQQATRIETDQKTGIVRIIINNREVARFDTNGLHVWDGIEHARTITYSPKTYNGPTNNAEPKH